MPTSSREDFVNGLLDPSQEITGFGGFALGVPQAGEEDCPRPTEPNSPLKKASLTGFHATAKHIAAKAVSPSSETMRTI